MRERRSRQLVGPLIGSKSDPRGGRADQPIREPESTHIFADGPQSRAASSAQRFSRPEVHDPSTGSAYL